MLFIDKNNYAEISLILAI